MMPDRSLIVPPGATIVTGYVDVWKCRLECRERMAIGDVDRAYQKLLQLGEDSMWPCPNGYWDEDIFVIKDGRHEYLAAVMLGKTTLFVAWIVGG